MINLVGIGVLWLIVGLVAGAAIAWLWRSRMMQASIAALQAESRSKYEQLKRDLDTRIARLENDLLHAKETIQARDSAVEERDRLIRQQGEQLAGGAEQIMRLTAESADRQAKLTKQEAGYAILDQEHRAARGLIAEQQKRIADDAAELAQLEPVPAKLADTKDKLDQALKNLEAAQAKFYSQDQEISRLHKRNVELEPLTIAVKDREAKLLELDGRLAEAVRLREAEIARLKKRVTDLEPLPQRLNDAEASRTQLAIELNNLRRAKDEEIQSLQEKLKAIDVLRQQIADRDAQSLRARDQETIAVREADLRRASISAELAVARQQLTQHSTQLEEKDAVIGKLHQQLAELAPIPEMLRKQDAQIRELEVRLAETASNLAARDEVLRNRIAQIERLEIDRASQRQQLEEMQREMDQRQRSSDHDAKRLREQIAELEPLIDGVAAQSARALELERGIRQREQQIRHSAHEVADLRADLLRWLRIAGALPAREAEIARLRARLQSLQCATSAARPNQVDDLKRIHGIGPVLERMLRDQGVVTFKQIAEWTEAEIDAIAAKLGSFSNRIVRDNWVGHAKAQHYEKYGERLGG